MDWNDLRFFVELARRGSLSATARQLKADHSTVARRIASLEAALDMKLFDRMPRGYLLTPEGERLLERAGAAEEAVHAIERLAAGRSGRIDGVVRISAPPTFASRWLVPRLAPLRRAHPDLTLDVIGETAAADLMRRDADIGLRLSRPRGNALVARRLGVLTYAVYAARSYLERVPEEAHEFLGYDQQLEEVPQQRWLEAFAAGRRFAMRTNDLASLISAAEAGMGLAVLPMVLAEELDDLVRVAEAAGAERELWWVLHPDLRRSARVRVVLDHLTSITAVLRR